MFLDWQYVEKNQVKQVVLSVTNLFKQSSNWIDWPIAVSEGGLEAQPLDLNAVKWSLLGAIDKFSYQLYPDCGNYVASATRDYLNLFLDGNRLWKASVSFDEEIKVLLLALRKIDKY